jgi:hypothetical protein
LKKPFTKKGWWSGQGVGPEFKPQYHNKKKKERNLKWESECEEIYKNKVLIEQVKKKI